MLSRLRRLRSGPDGNERLTALAGSVLLALLLVELATVPGLRQHVTWHMFVGLLLVPLIALKLASTGWRFSRYYLRAEAYRAKGPPQVLMRLLAPFLVLTTLTLLGSGVALVFLAPSQRSGVLGLHKASFALWIWLAGAHVLYYARRLPALLRADWGRRRGSGTTAPTVTPAGDVVLQDRASRAGLVAVLLLAGLALALATLPLDHHWAAYLASHHFGDD